MYSGSNVQFVSEKVEHRGSESTARDLRMYLLECIVSNEYHFRKGNGTRVGGSNAHLQGVNYSGNRKVTSSRNVRYVHGGGGAERIREYIHSTVSYQKKKQRRLKAAQYPHVITNSTLSRQKNKHMRLIHQVYDSSAEHTAPAAGSTSIMYYVQQQKCTVCARWSRAGQSICTRLYHIGRVSYS